MKQHLLLALAVAALLVTGQTVSAQPQGLIGHWPFDGDTLDYSGNEFHGTMVGTETYVPGVIGQALELDGSSYVDCGNHDAYNVGENLTMAVWFNVPGFTKTWETILSKGDNSYRFGTNNSGASHFGMNGPSGGWWNGTTIIDDGEWHHVACTYDGSVAYIYVDGAVDGEEAKTGAFGGDGAYPFYIGENAQQQNRMLGGTVDDVQLYNRALSLEEVQKIMKGLTPPELARPVYPKNEDIDIPRDLVLAWDPGEFAVTHNVYLGAILADVNEATAGSPLMVGQDLTDTTLDVGRLEFDQTYYLRVDEVNGAPDRTVFKGEVWSFTIEPHGRPITNVTATASSFNAGMGPELTVNGSGLNELDQHSTTATDMWLSGMGDPAPTIQFEFDKPYKLDVMLVWNSNQLIESFIGLGAKDVVVETSLDGAEWAVVEGATLFEQATGAEDYTANTTVDFAGVLAQHVRITVTAGYGMLPQYGLSEVRFLYIPTFAMEPQPADGSSVDSANVDLSWRAGREAAQHEIYLGTDPADLPLIATTTEASYTAMALDFSTTYHWYVTEVNENEAVKAYAGDVVTFTTPDYATVDDFDQYDDACNRIFFTWEDGLGHSGGEGVDNCDVPASNGNGGGSIVGNDQPPFAEKTIVNIGGSTQSMPFNYDNSFGDSYATRAIDNQDWTASGIKTLALAFSGAEGNTGTLYVQVNNTKILYDRNPADIARSGWQAWNIDLTGVGGLQNVTSLTIGVDGANAAGMLYIDDIRLYPLAGELITPVDPGAEGLVALYSFEGNANDSSGNGFNGTLEGGASYVAGQVGQALDCGGFDGYVSTTFSASDLGINSNNPRTVACWAFVRAFNNGGLFDVGARTGGQDFSLRTLGTDGNWRVQYWGGAFDIDFSLDALDKWVHFTHVYDGAATQIYANGILVASGAGILDTADTNPWQIGLYGWPGNYFDGLIDELHLYNRALSAEEALFMAGQTEPVHKPF